MLCSVGSEGLGSPLLSAHANGAASSAVHNAVHNATDNINAFISAHILFASSDNTSNCRGDFNCGQFGCSHKPSDSFAVLLALGSSIDCIGGNMDCKFVWIGGRKA